ncbi:MAG: chemotaxis protein CheW [Chloroflexi bacterium]|nr:chemotaxis protein CheW [Chloroflexota bacterium]
MSNLLAPSYVGLELAPDESLDLQETQRFLIFRLGEATFAVDIQSVYRVLRPGQLGPVPNMPSFVEGVTAIQGEILPIIHLGKRFRLEGQTDQEDERILVIDLPDQRVGLLVDAASEIVDIPITAFQPPPPIVSGISGEYISGITDWDERLIVLLDFNRIFSVAEVAALAELERETTEE